jgi:hypothetical protein
MERRMKRFVAAITFALLGALAVTEFSAHAWEVDVHYMLTFWLATEAGFSRRDADDIAKGDQSYDDGSYHAAIGTMCYIAATGDEGAARELQLKHFPSDARIPSPPQRRLVTANSASARAAVEAALRPTQATTALINLGEALHPFQDSWSHQGVPDIPFGLRPTLGCAHPITRGGWRSHDADLTHLHESEVVDMAKETCAILRRFLVQNPHFNDHPGVDCEELEPVIREFAKASTQQQKDTWAIKYTAEPRVKPALATLTLPGGYVPLIKEVTTVRVSREFAPDQRPPAVLVQDAQKFLDTWIGRRDIAGAVEFVEWNELKKQFADNPAFAESRDTVIRWCKKFMTMYLVEDHAAVNNVGHGDPKSGGYAELPESPPSQGKYRAALSFKPALLVPQDFIPAVIDQAGSPGALGSAPTSATGGRAASTAAGGRGASQTSALLRGSAFMLAVQIPTQPYDAVAFIWQQLAGRWMIVRMISIVA